MKNLLLPVLLLSLLFTSLAVEAQRCYTFEGDSLLGNSELRRDQFELWISQQIHQKKALTLGRTEATVLQIPVVFHVIHTGESVGQGSNIDDQQILSQLDVINQDFRRTNPDASDTPAEFLSVAADTEIEFVLAKQDPRGLPTNGINRVDGQQSQWTWEEQVAMKGLSQWPPEDYLNIWVADLVGPGGSNLLGYAQYPVQSGLDGITLINNNPQTDGVVVDYLATGSIEIYPQGNYSTTYNQGRTLTHEIGHFLGLRHIWGDQDNCASDFVNDTPDQSLATSFCPDNKSSCGSNDMFQNYMDYTQDACMNLFTGDQTTRMRTVLANSPRRLSLTTSYALNDPVTFNNDAGILSILAPGELGCPGSFTPSITIQNLGSNVLNEIVIDLAIDGNTVVSQTFNPGLNYLETATLTFNQQILTAGTNTTYAFSIVSVNGTADERDLINQVSVDIRVSETGNIPFSELFSSFPGNWNLNNYDEDKTWEQVNATNGTPANRSAFVNNYDYNANGQLDWMISPVLDLSNESVALLSFDYAYSNFPGAAGEALAVGIISGCDISAMDTVFYKAGSELITFPETSAEFTPSGSQDWATADFIDLSGYIGEPQIQLAFINRNGFGNNLFIDNVILSTDNSLDAGIKRIVSPGHYICVNQSELTAEIINNGSEVIESLDIAVTLGNGLPQNFSFPNVSMSPGATEIVSLGNLNLSAGQQEIFVEITTVNGNADDFPLNNILNYTLQVDSRTEKIPLRENFNNGEVNYFISFADIPALEFGLNQQLGNFFISTENYNTGREFQESWFISSILDLSDQPDAALFFDVSYAPGLTSSEELMVMASYDCGVTYTDVLYQKSGNNLATMPYEPNFFPSGPGTFRNEYIDLSSLVDEPQLRLAFRTINNRGNNLHIDNIEFFQDNNPDPLQINTNFTGIYPNPSNNKRFNLTFRLEEQTSIQVDIIDSNGRLIFSEEKNQVLNQTFEFYLPNAQRGFYFVKVSSPDFAFVDKLILK